MPVREVKSLSQENFDDTMKENLLQKFQQITDNNDRILVYFKGLVAEKYDTYEVILLYDDQTENTYLLNET